VSARRPRADVVRISFSFVTQRSVFVGVHVSHFGPEALGCSQAVELSGIKNEFAFSHSLDDFFFFFFPWQICDFLAVFRRLLFGASPIVSVDVLLAAVYSFSDCIVEL